MLTSGGIKVYTARDVETTLNCSRSQAYRLMNEKKFPTFRIGRRMYVLEEEFQRYLKQNTGKKIIV